MVKGLIIVALFAAVAVGLAIPIFGHKSQPVLTSQISTISLN